MNYYITNHEKAIEIFIYYIVKMIITLYSKIGNSKLFCIFHLLNSVIQDLSCTINTYIQHGFLLRYKQLSVTFGISHHMLEDPPMC